MKLRIKYIDKVVGLFILISVLTLAALLVFIGISQRWLKKNYYFKSKFESGSNLEVGMPIKLKGIEIGKLSRIELDPLERIVNVDFYIYEEYYKHTVYENSVLQVSVSPIGFGTSLVFHPGKFEGPPRPELQEGAYIPSNQTKEGQEILMRDVGAAGTGESVGDLIASVAPLLKQLEPTMLNINQTLVSINDAIMGTKKSKLGKLLFDVDDLVSNVDSIITGKDKGPVGNIITNVSSISDTLDGQVDQEMKRIDGILKNVEAISLQVSTMTADPKGLIVDLVDPKGSLKTLLDDNNVLFNDIEEMLESVKEIIREMEKVAKFITGVTPQISGILEEGKKTLDQGQDVLEALKNNPLLSGGITAERKQPTTYQSHRDDEFE
ncbi:MAG: MCE family protein [Spirochaetales bacterium]|nr:MCE family protein [Spirochaetales bacterium]